jgi:simple sugar transport system substrate-binding protein
MRALRVGVLVVAVLAIAVACQKQAGSDVKAGRDKISVVFVTASQPNDPFWNVVKRGAVDAGKDLGVKVQYIGSETFDLTKMVQNMEAAIASKPSGIVVPIYDFSVLEKPIQKAIDAGIPVVEIGSIIQPKGSLCTIGQDDYSSGKRTGQWIADAGATNILCVNHEPGNIGLEDRGRGVADGAPKAKVTQAAILSKDPAAFQQQLTAALKADPAIDAIVTNGPVEAVLTIKTLEEAGLSGKVRIATFDLSPEVLTAIDEGKILFALDQQQYLMGYLPVIFITNYTQYLISPVGLVSTGPGAVFQKDAKRIVDLSAKGVR